MVNYIAHKLYLNKAPKKKKKTQHMILADSHITLLLSSLTLLFVSVERLWYSGVSSSRSARIWRVWCWLWPNVLISVDASINLRARVKPQTTPNPTLVWRATPGDGRENRRQLKYRSQIFGLCWCTTPGGSVHSVIYAEGALVCE